MIDMFRLTNKIRFMIDMFDKAQKTNAILLVLLRYMNHYLFVPPINLYHVVELF